MEPVACRQSRQRLSEQRGCGAAYQSSHSPHCTIGDPSSGPLHRQYTFFDFALDLVARPRVAAVVVFALVRAGAACVVVAAATPADVDVGAAVRGGCVAAFSLSALPLAVDALRSRVRRVRVGDSAASARGTPVVDNDSASSTVAAAARVVIAVVAAVVACARSIPAKRGFFQRKRKRKTERKDSRAARTR